MLKLPEIKLDPKKTSHLCKCRPICKSRRREWKGDVQNTSAELLLERKPKPECFRRWPTKVYPNSPCPLFSTTRRVTVKERGYIPPPEVVRICQAPIDDTVDTTYLRLAQLAKKLGAWDAVKSCCAFCECNNCCPCSPHGYYLSEECDTTRWHDMRQFDSRVEQDCQDMKIMYH
ncbi:unnamed protein product [Pieris macdunnoughi]|uniref:Uncharacterized protein n=1 Tax=Pieris macdunnoughi TaxID=345717 RepID=A0A821Y023_9NEOP|nr:unnamed protein product [Pieris macdunnoughi]